MIGPSRRQMRRVSGLGWGGSRSGRLAFAMLRMHQICCVFCCVPLRRSRPTTRFGQDGRRDALHRFEDRYAALAGGVCCTHGAGCHLALRSVRRHMHGVPAFQTTRFSYLHGRRVEPLPRHPSGERWFEQAARLPFSVDASQHPFTSRATCGNWTST